jgi:hypothetical protein
VDAYDIGLRSDRLRQTQEENDQLRTRLAAANAKANQAFSNSLDFTTKMTAQMGDWKKNIGTAPPILAGKAGANAWQIQQQQEAEGETP